jgi:tRNA pseudouridine55 synthase
MNGLVLMNKPKGMTSFDLVAQTRRILSVSKVGHAGTLDPNAEGLMVLLLNKATKALPYLNLDPKRYRTTLQLGVKTDTGDVWGKTLAEHQIPKLTTTQIAEVLNSFLGDQMQTPPMVSAVSVAGKRLYEYHRQGIEVERTQRKIHIFALELVAYEDSFIVFDAEVSSGTYIRTLCEDVAERLGTLGTMNSLVRTALGSCELKHAHTLDTLNGETVHVLPIEAFLKAPMMEYADELHLKQGKPLQLESEASELVMSVQNKAVAVYRKNQETLRYECVRGLW